MLKTVTSNPWVQAAALAAGLLLFCLVCYLLSPVLVPLFFAFLVAYILDPVIDFFERRRVPRGVTIAALFLIGAIVLLAIPLLLVPSLVGQAEALMQAAAHGVDRTAVSSRLDALLGRLPLEDLVRYLGWADPNADSIDARAILALRIGGYVKENALQLVRNYAPSVAGAGQWAGLTLAQVVASFGRATVSFVIFLGNFVLFAFVTAYLLRDFDRLVAGARELVPPKRRDHVADIVGKIDRQMRSFLRGQMCVCAGLAIMYTTGLLISGVPFGFLLGVFGGVASFVPYLGLALTILPSLFLAALQHGVDWHLLAVLATFAVGQVVEGTFLTPRIVGREVGLNPVWVILAVMVFGSFLGFLGLLLAVPIAASLKVLVLEAVAYYRKSPVFASGGGDGGGGGG